MAANTGTFIKFPNWIIKASNWMDRNIFKIPADDFDYALLINHQKEVEADALKITRSIIGCKTLAQTYSVRKMVDNFKKKHNGTTQVCSWVDSLLLDLYNREKEILN